MHDPREGVYKMKGERKRTRAGKDSSRGEWAREADGQHDNNVMVDRFGSLAGELAVSRPAARQAVCLGVVRQNPAVGRGAETALEQGMIRADAIRVRQKIQHFVEAEALIFRKRDVVQVLVDVSVHDGWQG